MHNGRAAYVQSPYVDAHGETPQVSAPFPLAFRLLAP
jgi:hypothetical protein